MFLFVLLCFHTSKVISLVPSILLSCHSFFNIPSLIPLPPNLLPFSPFSSLIFHHSFTLYIHACSLIHSLSLIHYPPHPHPHNLTVYQCRPDYREGSIRLLRQWAILGGCAVGHRELLPGQVSSEGAHRGTPCPKDYSH